ncbi:UNVERIFIED_CONTAM: hypothetical protein Cloal_2320 [Acetivibrio alkalicellulosi]
MELLVLVLNKTDELEFLLKEFMNMGIKGATVIDSTGMASFFDDDNDIPIFASLKLIINKNNKSNKTLFVVLHEEQVDDAIDTIERTIGDLSKPGVGIVFTLPLNRVKGGMFEDL